MKKMITRWINTFEAYHQHGKPVEKATNECLAELHVLLQYMAIAHYPAKAIKDFQDKYVTYQFCLEMELPRNYIFSFQSDCGPGYYCHSSLLNTKVNGNIEGHDQLLSEIWAEISQIEGSAFHWADLLETMFRHRDLFKETVVNYKKSSPTSPNRWKICVNFGEEPDWKQPDLLQQLTADLKTGWLTECIEVVQQHFFKVWSEQFQDLKHRLK